MKIEKVNMVSTDSPSQVTISLTEQAVFSVRLARWALTVKKYFGMVILGLRDDFSSKTKVKKSNIVLFTTLQLYNNCKYCKKKAYH